MTSLRTAIARLRGIFGGDRADARIDEEIAAHLEMLAAEFESRGMSPREARLAARREFGGVAQMRENWREQRGLPFLDALRQDLRYARAQMRKHPGFAVTAILTLALGIGANAIVYQVLESVVYRPLPVRAPRQLQLLEISEDGKQKVGDAMQQDLSYPQFRELAARQNIAESLIASGTSMLPSGEGKNAEKLTITLVSGNYFAGLGAGVAVGRALTPADDRPGAPPVAVLSPRFWEKRFGNRPEALGQTLALGGAAVTVVGVADARFYGLTLGWEPDAWIPAALQPQVLRNDYLRDNENYWLNVIARLKPGVTPERAQASLDAIYRSLPGTAHRHLTLRPGYRGLTLMRDGTELIGIALMALVSVVLLIACCNLANLVLGRGAARMHEIGVRLAMGAGRGRIVRQLLTECLALAAAGTLAALALAAWAWPELTRILELPFPGGRLEWRTCLFAAAIAGIAACIFGLAPALTNTRLDLLTALQANRRTYSSGRATHRLGRLLIAAQIAVSVVLVYGAGVLGRSLWNLQHSDVGFRTERLLIATFAWDQEAASAGEFENDPFAGPLLDRLNHLPGVVSAALCAFGPLGNSTATGPLSTPDHPSKAANDVLIVPVSPGYFETMGIRILRGRGISDAERAGSHNVAVLGETEARRLFGSADPVGRLVSASPTFKDEDAVEVVGVARDIRFSGPHSGAAALYYVPLAQAHVPVTSIAVRTAGDPDRAASAVRRVLREMAPGREIAKIEPVAETVEGQLVNDYLLAFSTSGFSLLALALTALGIYGVIAYAMVGRTREIGIRLALGAPRISVARMVAREYFPLVGASAAVGVVVAVGTARLARGMVFGVAPNDYLTLAGAAAVLAVVAVLAGWLPARRASRMDPIVALREE